MYTQKSGTEITADNADQFANDYLQNATLPTVQAKRYTQADLSLTESDQAHLVAYKNAITAVFTKYWPKDTANELTIMQKALVEEGNEAALSGLTPIINSYQAVLSNSLALSVPKLAVSLHLNVINSLATYIQTLKMVQQTYTDPLSGLVGLNTYETSKSNFYVSTISLQMYFINNLK
jgi:hypothetical protein